MAEYALVCGNNWFVLQVELPVGSLYRVRRLTVRDTFGITSTVAPSRNLDGTRWTMFNLSNDPGGLADLFFLPPTLPFRLEGDPLEQVALVRDEMANMAWAIEHIVQGGAGPARDRRMELPVANVHQRVPGDHITAELIYRLATPVSEQWLPFVTVPTAPNQPADSFSIQLEQRAMLRTRLDGTQVPIYPQGILMKAAEEGPLRLHEEEVPPEGAVVERSFQYTRWMNGSRFLCAGRRKYVSKGPGNSGLRYDVSLYAKDITST